MPIQSGDIKIFESDTMDDTAQGGGAITGNVVVDGVSNNIFEDISTLDRVYGAVHMRKIFPAVNIQTQDKYFGAHAIISKLPGDEKLGINLFNTEDWFDRRDAAKSRVESYRAKGATYAGFLWATQWSGSSVLTIFQDETTAVPGIGDVLYLTNTAGNEFQFVKITTFDSVEQAFTDPNGTYYRTILTLGISQPLDYDFVGSEISRYDNLTPDATIKTTVVANAAKYFSARPAALSSTTGDTTVKVDTVYSQVIPSSLQELAILDADMNDTTQAVMNAASNGYSAIVVTSVVFQANSKFYIGSPVAPGSLIITIGGASMIDNGGDLLVAGTTVGDIDYATGVMTFNASAPVYSGSKSIAFAPGAAPTNVAGTTMLEVTAANRGLIWNSTLNPAPLPNSVQVSYQALGEWYTLYDNGAGGLVGETSGIGSGSVNYATGTVSLTAAALPDVNSAILFSWQKAARYFNRADLVPKPIEYRAYLTQLPVALGTLVLTWNDGTARTASANAAGLITGDGVGKINHNTGYLEFTPDIIPLGNQTIDANYSYGAVASEEHIATAPITTNDVATINVGDTNLTPGSVELEWNVELDPAIYVEEIDNATGTQVGQAVAIDDGLGGLLLNGVTPIVGATIDYATGIVMFDTGVQIATKIAQYEYTYGELYTQAYAAARP